MLSRHCCYRSNIFVFSMILLSAVLVYVQRTYGYFYFYMFCPQYTKKHKNRELFAVTKHLYANYNIPAGIKLTFVLDLLSQNLCNQHISLVLLSLEYTLDLACRPFF